MKEVYPGRRSGHSMNAARNYTIDKLNLDFIAKICKAFLVTALDLAKHNLKN